MAKVIKIKDTVTGTESWEEVTSFMTKWPNAAENKRRMVALGERLHQLEVGKPFTMADVKDCIAELRNVAHDMLEYMEKS